MDGESHLTLRLADAVEDDARLLWEWRNDPDTRAASFSPGEIPWEAHLRWYRDALADPKHLILIGFEEGEPIGVVRFDERKPAEAEVHLIVAPEARGRGLGRKLLTAACDYACRIRGFNRLIASIKESNVASRQVFAAASFGPECRSTLTRDGREIPVILTTREGFPR
jgi:RimJ/RimL family protein N-acetyltransferase